MCLNFAHYVIFSGHVWSDCPEQDIAIIGGHYKLTREFNPGSMLIYYCPERYYPYPHLTRVCQQNNTWKSTRVSRRALPQRCRCKRWRHCFSYFCLYGLYDLVYLFCVTVVECPDPNVLISGNVSPPQDKYFVDNETTYECDSGYTLRGSSRRVCLPNGKWSGSTPICSRDSRPHIHSFLLSPCSPLSPHHSWILSCSSMQ